MVAARVWRWPGLCGRTRTVAQMGGHFRGEAPRTTRDIWWQESCIRWSTDLGSLRSTDHSFSSFFSFSPTFSVVSPHLSLRLSKGTSNQLTSVRDSSAASCFEFPLPVAPPEACHHVSPAAPHQYHPRCFGHWSPVTIQYSSSGHLNTIAREERDQGSDDEGLLVPAGVKIDAEFSVLQ